MADELIKFGSAWTGEKPCCGKAVGCSNLGEGCLLRRHPWKQRNVPGWREAVVPPRQPEGN